MQLIPGIRINMDLPSNGGMQSREPARVVYGAALTKKLPLVQFGGDIPIAANSDNVIDVTALMGQKCAGFLLINVVGIIQRKRAASIQRATSH